MAAGAGHCRAFVGFAGRLTIHQSGSRGSTGSRQSLGAAIRACPAASQSVRAIREAGST